MNTTTAKRPKILTETLTAEVYQDPPPTKLIKHGDIKLRLYNGHLEPRVFTKTGWEVLQFKTKTGTRLTEEEFLAIGHKLKCMLQGRTVKVKWDDDAQAYEFPLGNAEFAALLNPA